MGPLELQERNVNVFDSQAGGVVIAGISHSLITSLPLSIDDVCRVLAIWQSPMG
jgi:hypothetical protein